jgi:hypothetical protein
LATLGISHHEAAVLPDPHDAPGLAIPQRQAGGRDDGTGGNSVADEMPGGGVFTRADYGGTAWRLETTLTTNGSLTLWH